MDDLVFSILKELLVAKHRVHVNGKAYTLTAVNRGQVDNTLYTTAYLYAVKFHVTGRGTSWNVTLHFSPYMNSKTLHFHLVYSQDVHGSELRDSLEKAANKLLKDKVLEAITGDV
jgi:hypothetical protein